MKFTSIVCTDGTVFATSDGENLMARYSRIPVPKRKVMIDGVEKELMTRSPYKNTLLTIAEGDTVFFGISRCNLDAGDRFSRSEGRSRALHRLLAARLPRSDDGKKRPLVFTASLNSNMHLSENMLCGWCKKEPEFLEHLLDHFHNIDEVMDVVRRAKYEAQGTTKKRRKQPPTGDSTVAVSP